MAQNITVLYMAGCHLSRWQNGVFGHVRAQVTATLFVFTLVTPRGTTVQVGQRPKGHWDPCIFIQVSFNRADWQTNDFRLDCCPLHTLLLITTCLRVYRRVMCAVNRCWCWHLAAFFHEACGGAIGGACGIICYGVNRLIDIHLVLRVQKQQWPPSAIFSPFFLLTPIMRTV